MHKNQIISYLLLILSLGTGCTTVEIRGHKIEDDQIKSIKVGQTTKEEVAEILGTPSTVSPFNNKSWFYISEITEKVAFFTPSIAESKVVVIDFDNHNRVQKIDIKTKGDMQAVAHVSRTTPTSGHRFSIAEQLLGNVGRFEAKDVDENQR